jgi:hypothetical protein
MRLTAKPAITDLRDIVRKIIKLPAFIVCLAGSYLVLMPGTFLTIGDNEKWKIAARGRCLDRLSPNPNF